MSADEQQPTSIPGLAHGQLCYLQIPARDVAASASFYERVLGWRTDPPENGFEVPGLIGQWVTERPPAPTAGPVAWFYVEDIRATLRAAEEAGASGCEGPAPDGPRELGTFSDPGGNLVGLVAHASAHPRRAPVRNRTMPPATILPHLVYEDVPVAIEWLCEAFGFLERWRAGPHRAQLSFADGAVVVAERSSASDLPGPVSVLVRVPDVRAHHERAAGRGARIVAEPRDYPYGERQYTAEDPAGHRWTFSESIADLAPEDWGGTSGPGLDAEPAGR